jgi:cytoskeletal protein RodZ
MMKKAGDLLKEARIQKKLTIEEVHEGTKIRPSYIEAIENSNYTIFHSLTTIRGFLRNYANFLDLNPESIIAVHRREESIKSLSNKKRLPLGLNNFHISSNVFVVLAALLVVSSVIVFLFISIFRSQNLHILIFWNQVIFMKQPKIKYR